MPHPIISIIVVMSPSRAIGCGNKLLWDIPEDMAHFRKITQGHPVIMGRKTFESIGKPLPGRTNIVISLPEENYAAPDCLNAHSLEEAIALGKEHDELEIFVIGGGTIYRLALPLADKLYITKVDDEPEEVDTYFPDYSEFSVTVSEKSIQTDKYFLTFYELVRSNDLSLPEPIPSAGVVVLKDGKVLLVKHTVIAGHKTGSYGLPAGRIEAGENAINAAVRELAEETGLICDPGNFKLFPGSELYGLVERSDGTKKLFSFTVFLCTEFEGELRSSNETAPEWVDIKNLNSVNMIINVRKLIKSAHLFRKNYNN